MHENFAYYLKNYAPEFPSGRPSQERRARIADLLKPSLAQFINQHGFVSFHGGLFRLCDPDEVRPVLELIFRGDKDFTSTDCHVVGYTAFGVLQCWSDRYRAFQIELPLGTIYCSALTKVDRAAPTATDDHIASGLVLDREDADFLDAAGEPMFDRCVAAHGRPTTSECFGFVPALAMSGAFGALHRVENTKRMSAIEHFAILAQLQQFHLVAVGREDIVPVRPVG